MTLFHRWYRRRLGLLASEALEGREKDSVLAHLDACANCGTDLASLRGVLDLVKADPVRDALPSVPTEALLTRVRARLDEREPLPAASWMRFAWPAVAAAVVLALVWLRSPVPPGGSTPAVSEVQVPEEFLHRIERNMAREQTVRYLNEAQDVLVTVAAKPRKCRRGEKQVDVAQEARRSRELLARRALVEMDRADVASVRPVIHDVERVLREVASFEACARPGQVESIRREIERRRLLMKIDLMTRELQG